MTKRPVSVTVIGYLFIVAGLVGVIYHATEFSIDDWFDAELLLVLILRLLAIVAGMFVLRGRSWARWLLLGWMAIHVVLGALHALSELAAHAILLAVLAYFLLRPSAAKYFRQTGAGGQ